jgi:uncharacterized integral membrane protein
MAKANKQETSTAKVVTVGIIAILLLIIALQNTSMIAVNILFWTVYMSKILLIIVAAVFGFIIGLITQSMLKKKR